MIYIVTHRPPAAEVWFNPRPVHLRFVVDKVAVGHVLSPVVLFSPASTIPPTFQTQYYLNYIHIRSTRVQSLRTFEHKILFRLSWPIKQREKETETMFSFNF